MQNVWKKLAFLAALILVFGAPVLGALAVRWRISDLSSGKPPTAGRVAWVAEGKLWVKDLPNGKARQLAAGENISRPAWSPTGRWLLFRRGEDLWLVGVGRGKARRVAQRVDEFACSPVADVFVCTAGGELCLGEPAKERPRVLVKREAGFDLGRIAWSPDGKWVAFERLKVGQSEAGQVGIWKVDAASGAVARVYISRLRFDRERGVVGEVPRLAGWSPDGEMVILWRGPCSASIEADGLPLGLAPSDGYEEPVPVVGKGWNWESAWESAVLVRPGFVATAPGKLAFVIGAGRDTWTNKRLAVYDFQSGELAYLTGADWAVIDPAFSPDGKLLVYSAGPEVKDAGGYEQTLRQGLASRRLWVVGTDGGKPRRLTNDPAYRDERPFFSADGRYILFARLDGENKVSLWLVQPDGSGLEQVVESIGLLTGDFTFGYYGAVTWNELFAYWPGVADAALINATKGTPEAKKLLARYPWAKIVVDRSGKLAVDFRVDKLESGDEPGPYLRLRVFIDPATNIPADRFLDLNGRVIRTEILRHLDEETVFGTKVPYLNPAYGVYLEFPRHWRPRPGYDDVAGIPGSYGGDDGFFLVSAMNGEGLTPEEVARHEASHKLKPYGERPRLEKTTVNGREGYFVFPSPELGVGAGACCVVPYPRPVAITGEKYHYFILYGDAKHIRDLAASLRFL
ncbi:MAG: PD40 domain-containing protein [Syntrophothermus sp.]|uniref:DPP IV N-terminal domain-containing protein n=1 Tax=Syntrophothermus sp. TaxID=2736299 RepID=UPI0025806EFC|nr:DPP IV N-terminal domain-containing protein [Syntrophothermus sp.]NSW84226.1 PD40 domain-containing protein [Syntrophothermus sp.]